MNLSQFDYRLPEELIAQHPPAERDGARMLVVYRNEGRWEDRAFRGFPQFLGPGDCLVLNDSKVFPSRLFGLRENRSGQVEVLLLRPVSADAMEWEALVRPGRKMPVGERVRFEGGIAAEILTRGELGRRTLRFLNTDDIYAALERIGHVPLPPYIRRPDDANDRERYQTVFAKERGSVAAPTAGLHFTPEILERVLTAGADIARVTLHVGLGTFQPIPAEVTEAHRLHSEHYAIDENDWQRIENARRVVAVGTTGVRSIESAALSERLSGETDLFIYPGFSFRRTGALLTNFHLPRTSLVLLVCAFAGKELTMSAYEHAVRERYRFFSYGDCMLIV